MSRSCRRLRKLRPLDLFFLSIQYDPTPINMANRDNGDDKNGRKKRNFSIDDDAFASDDDCDFMIDDEFEAFINPSQKKKLASLKPKDFSQQQAENIVRPDFVQQLQFHQKYCVDTIQSTNLHGIVSVRTACVEFLSLFSYGGNKRPFLDS